MLTLRLLPEGELDGNPAQCVELAVPRRGGDTITVTSLRLMPSDLVRLRAEVDPALGGIRADVLRAESTWRQLLGRWFEEGRAAVGSLTPDVALLTRVLEDLRTSL